MAVDLNQVNRNPLELNLGEDVEVRLEADCEAETDEQLSYAGNKLNQRWLWYAVDHTTNTGLAYVFGKRMDEVFKKLMALLEPFGVTRYYTDD